MQKIITELKLAKPNHTYELSVKTDPNLGNYNTMLTHEVHVIQSSGVCIVHLFAAQTPSGVSSFSCPLGDLSSIEENGVVLVKLMDNDCLKDSESVRIEEAQSESRPEPNA